MKEKGNGELFDGYLVSVLQREKVVEIGLQKCKHALP